MPDCARLAALASALALTALAMSPRGSTAGELDGDEAGGLIIKRVDPSKKQEAKAEAPKGKGADEEEDPEEVALLKRRNGKDAEKPDGKDPKKAGEKEPAVDVKKGAKKDDPPAKAPAPKEPEKPKQYRCLVCRDTGQAPCPNHNPKRPLVRIEGENGPPCCQGVAWRPCVGCSKPEARDAWRAELSRLSDIGKSSVPVEEGMKIKLLDAECEHMGLHIESGRSVDASAMAQTAETLIAEIHKAMGEGVAEEIRSPESRVFVLKTTKRYRDFCDFGLKEGILKDHKLDNGNSWMDLCKQCGGFTQQTVAVIDREMCRETWLHMLCANMSTMFLTQYVKRQIPDWMSSGFASWAQATAMKSILVYEINYEKTNENPVGRWPAMVRTAIQQKKAKSWTDIYATPLVGAKSMDHAYFYSIASFLIARDGKTFVKFLQAFDEEGDVVKALEKAYGARFAQIENDWLAWAAKQTK